MPDFPLSSYYVRTRSENATEPNQWVLVSCVTLKRAGCVKKDREQFTLKSVESDCLLPLRIHAAQLATRKQLIPASLRRSFDSSALRSIVLLSTRCCIQPPQRTLRTASSQLFSLHFLLFLFRAVR